MSYDTSVSRALALCFRSPWRFAIESASIQAAPTAARLYAFPPQATWAAGEAKTRGANTSTLKTNSISARSRVARTSTIPDNIAMPASTKQIPVSTVQKSPPKGIHFGTMRATSGMWVRCPRPKATEQSPKAKRARKTALGTRAELRPASESPCRFQPFRPETVVHPLRTCRTRLHRRQSTPRK